MLFANRVFQYRKEVEWPLCLGFPLDMVWSTIGISTSSIDRDERKWADAGTEVWMSKSVETWASDMFSPYTEFGR